MILSILTDEETDSQGRQQTAQKGNIDFKKKSPFFKNHHFFKKGRLSKVKLIKLMQEEAVLICVQKGKRFPSLERESISTLSHNKG